MLDLATEQGALAFCEEKRREMEGVFADRGRFEMNGYSFGAYVFATHQVLPPERSVPVGAHKPLSLEDVIDRWRTGDELPMPRAERCRLPSFVSILIPDDQQTAFFGRAVRVLSDKSRAIGTVVMGEMWMARPDHVPGETAEQARARLPKSLEDYDGRTEGLFLRLEHKFAGSRMWTKAIHRDPDRLDDEWVLFEETDGNTEGRLVNLVGRP
jgi:hypothetical protein